MNENVENKTAEQKQISDKLLNHFSFSLDDFTKPIQWTDGVGLSRVKKLENDYASLYKIGIGDKELQKTSPRKNLWISVSYGKETAGGITLRSDGVKISDPVDLNFYDESSYDIQDDKFYYHQKEIKAAELFKNIEEAHMRPTKTVKGFVIRCRLWFWREALPALVRLVDLFLVGLLWVVSGERVKDNIWGRLMGTRFEKITEQIPKKETEFEESKKMDFFGYKAKRWSVVFYCALHLVVFAFFFLERIKYVWITTLFDSNFLALCYVVVSFAFTEALVPQILKSMISRIMPKIFSSIAFKTLKI